MGTLGLRENEALGARWEWLDRRRQVYVVGEAKDMALREIPVPDWFMAFLEALRGERESGLIIPSSKLAPDTQEPLPHNKTFTQKPIDTFSLPKLNVDGSIPFARSKNKPRSCCARRCRPV